MVVQKTSAYTLSIENFAMAALANPKRKPRTAATATRKETLSRKYPFCGKVWHTSNLSTQPSKGMRIVMMGCGEKLAENSKPKSDATAFVPVVAAKMAIPKGVAAKKSSVKPKSRDREK